MERLLANAMVWKCYDAWADEYAAVLDDELRATDERSSLLDDLVAARDSKGDTWIALVTYMLPIFDVYDLYAFERELVSDLETVYRDENVSLDEFNDIAFNVSLLLDRFGIQDDDILEFAFASGFMDVDDGALTRKYYEDVFARFRDAD